MNFRMLQGLLVLSLVLLLTAGTVTPAISQSQTDDLSREIDAFVGDQMEKNRIPGVAVTILRDGEVFHSGGYGHTSDEDQPVTPQTPFVIGSTTKSITALAIMQLVEAGQVDLDAPVQQYLPWFTLADTDRTARITVRHLLTMTSGISPLAGGEAFQSTVSMSPEEAVRSLANASFIHEPGERFEYVNANYAILGVLITEVSGQSFGDYLRENIFEPLEMHNSFTDPESARAAGFVDGHRYWFSLDVPFETPDLPQLVPAGYVISSSEDLSHYLEMYLNDGVYNGRQIISPEGIAELQTGVFDFPMGDWADGAPTTYAMGWLVGGPWGDGPTIFHTGGAPSFMSTLYMQPDQDLAVVVLANSANYIPLPGAHEQLRQLHRGVMDLMTGREPAESAGLVRFYLIFNIVLAVLGVSLIFGLVRVIRRDFSAALDRSHGLVFQSLPLVWEFGLSIALLIAANVFTAWRYAWVWVPDLLLAVLAIATLWILTGLIRSVKLFTAMYGRRPAGQHQTAP